MGEMYTPLPICSIVPDENQKSSKQGDNHYLTSNIENKYLTWAMLKIMFHYKHVLLLFKFDNFVNDMNHSIISWSISKENFGSIRSDRDLPFRVLLVGNWSSSDGFKQSIGRFHVILDEQSIWKHVVE